MHNVRNNVGGFINVSSSRFLPTDSNQANYIRVKNKKSVTDPLLSVTQRMKSYKENNQEIFICFYALDDVSPIWQIFAVLIKINSNRCYL